MKIQPRIFEDAMDLIHDILKQGDSRYNDFDSEAILSLFLIKEAIILEEKQIPFIEEENEEDAIKNSLKEVQWAEKYIGMNLLKKEAGFKDNEIFLERRFLGSVVDVLAEKDNKIIPVECCSCRVSKIIDFLQEVDEIWVLTRGDPHWKNSLGEEYLMRWFIFKKGVEWRETYKKFKQKRAEELKKIYSPLDNLMK